MFQVTKSMKSIYVSRRKEDLARLYRHLENKNFEEIRSIGHRIVGSAKNYGYPELEIIAAKLENLGASGSNGNALEVVEQFRNWVNGQEKQEQ